MIRSFARANGLRQISAALFLSTALALPVGTAFAGEPFPYTQSLAIAAADDAVITAFYQSRNFAPLWTGSDAAARAALFAALDAAGTHGLPVARYDAGALRQAFQTAHTEGDRGRLEYAMTRAFLAYAHDLSSGVLDPAKVDDGIKREISRPDPAALLARVAGGSLPQLLHDLLPKAPEYARLMKAKLDLEALVAAGGYGEPIAGGKLQPGDSGARVVALRDRLVALGYLPVSASQTYDRFIQAAVQRFQLDHGLTADGVAGESTIAELNVPAEARLQSVVVAMERLRWMRGTPRGDVHIWVNQPDFTARIVDHGKVIFQTRAVIGKNVPEQRSPEFSDTMEHMVINPSWGVPRSIIVKEYLPLLQQNPNAVAHLQVVDGNGRVVSRGAVNFAAYSASSFPFGLRQPPSDGNALGKVKFMFPNPYNIYLHDTPAKELFANEVRAYSHGCIRLADPFDFGYTLLGMQTDDPKGLFHEHLDTGNETIVKLEHPLPVHLVYFTAWPNQRGEITYRRDIYGRDGRIFDALAEAGVVLGGVQG